MPYLPEDRDLIDQFLEWKLAYYNIAENTIKTYRPRLLNFAAWIQEQFGLHLKVVTSEVILKYRDKVTHEGGRNATICTHMATVKSFYTWLAHPTVQIIERSPFPDVRLESPARMEEFVPSAQQIFKCRMYGTFKRVSHAAAFEFMLSTGMRVSELRELRCCDLNFDHDIEDYALKKPSPFVGGMLYLSPHLGISIKTRNPRKVMFSKLAAKLIKKHMILNRLTADSPLPLFPYTTKRLNDWIIKITKPIHQEIKQPIKRLKGFKDVSEEDLKDLPRHFRRSIELSRERVESFEKRYPNFKRVMHVEPPKNLNVHPHCLRHFFAMLMYYRTWYGSRHDIQAVSMLLGHKNINQTQQYMALGPRCKNDQEWNRIMIGNGMDYRQFFIG